MLGVKTIFKRLMINEREVFILIYLDNAATTKAFEEVLDTLFRK